MPHYQQLPSGLVVPATATSTANAAAFAERVPRPELGEVATTFDGRDITRGFVDALPLLPPQDSVLQARGANDLAIYDEVLRDDQVMGTFEGRRRALVAKEWEVLPGGKKRRDKAAADFISEMLDHIRWDAITDKMLFAVFYGYAVGECLFKREGSRVGLDALKVRDRRRFGFRPAGDLVMRTTRNPDGEALPPRKFWSFATGANHDDEPYGLGLAHWLYWPVLFKRNGVKFWLVFLEKFGMPTGVGKFPSNATAAERATLLQAVQAIQADSGIIIPEGMALELLEAARSGTADYTALYDRMNAAISKVVLGHSAGADATPGRLGGEDNAMDVRDDLIKSDSDLVCNSANMTWVRWLVDWNFPGAAYPKIWRRIDDEPDLAQQADRDKKISEMGFRPRLDYIREAYGDGWEERTPAAGDAGTAPPPAVADQAAFAEDTAPDYAQVAAATVGRAVEPAVRDWLDVVRAILESAESLEEAREQIAAAYGDLDIEAAAGTLGEALAAAELAGRFEAGSGES